MLSEGTILEGRYRIVELIGVGGMASVFEAEHLGVGRRVALKLLHSAYAENKELVARFEHEARTATHIAHDHIVEVIDVGTHRRLPFMVMEMLYGVSLASRVEGRVPMELTQACHIIDQVLEALEYVHAMGVIHRDLKPENIHLIERAGIVDFVKILDFGVSKAQLESRAHPRTRSGVVMGTPHYMAPEQALARKDADHRVDLYAAGVMLFEMVTGSLPVDALNTTELLLQIVNRKDPLPRASSLVAIMPAALDDAIARAIALPRDERFESATAFREAIAPFVPPRSEDGRQSSSMPPLLLERVIAEPMADEPSEPSEHTLSAEILPSRTSVPTLHAWGPSEPPPRREPSLPPPSASIESPPVDPPSLRFVPRPPTPPSTPSVPPGVAPRLPDPSRVQDLPLSAESLRAPRVSPSLRLPHESGVTVPPTEVSPRTSSDNARPRRAAVDPSWKRTALSLAVGLCLGVAIMAPMRWRRPVAPAAAAASVAHGLAAPPTPANTTVRLEGLPPGARVTIDGAEATARGLSVPPGSSHRVRVEADGFVPWEGELTAHEAVWVWSLAPVAPAPAAPVAAPPADPLPAAPVAVVEPSTTTISESSGRHHHHRRRH